MASGLRTLGDLNSVRDDLSAVIELGFDATRHAAVRPDPQGRPLSLHGSYLREEILAALGSTVVPKHFREGVLNVVVEGHPVDVFLVTLEKSEADFSPSTRYRDYALSPTLFHWESQSTTSVASPTGQRYLSGASTVLLFVRQQKTGDFGPLPYTYLGPATYVSHTGDRPIAITWRLETPMPAALYTEAALGGVSQFSKLCPCGREWPLRTFPTVWTRVGFVAPQYRPQQGQAQGS